MLQGAVGINLKMLCFGGGCLCEGVQNLEQVTQRSCGNIVYGDINNVIGHSPGHTVLPESAWAEMLNLIILRGSFQPQQFRDDVKS